MVIGAAIKAGMRRATFAVLLAACLLALDTGAVASRPAGQPQRVVSINACTDQLLFSLADPDQIAALTHYAIQEDFSVYAQEVRERGVPTIRGGAEEVLKLQPDLILAGTFTSRATRELLAQQSIGIELFPAASSIEETRTIIRRAARLLGHEARGEAMIAAIDRALAAIPDLSAQGLTVLQFQRRGFVSGPETLIGELLHRLGVTNAATQLGIGTVEWVSLEAAMKARADALVLFDPVMRAADQGSALLLHPALAEAYPSSRRVTVPGRLVICPGPALPRAIEVLTEAIERLEPRRR